PNLYDLRMELREPGALLDRVDSYFGMRKLSVEGPRVLLNNRPYFQRLVLDQGYHPEGLLAAPADDALRADVEWAKRFGFNGVRKHQKVEDPRFLYWCDRLGLLVWGEMANAYEYSPAAMERLTREWLDVLARDNSHPCIVAWVPINESWGVPDAAHDPAQQHYLQALYHLTKAMDPTRPALDNEGWEHIVSDVYGIHDYAFDGALLRERY